MEGSSTRPKNVERLNTQCVILAGGLGTRMLPSTKEIPKALLPVLGKSFIEYQLEHLAKSDVTEVILCLGHQGGKIERHVGNGASWGVRARFIYDRDGLEGTGAALRAVADSGMLLESFLVLYGDSFLPIDLAPMISAFHKSNRQALMAVFQNNNQWDESNVVFESGKILLYEKRSLPTPGKTFIDCGLSLFTRKIIQESIPRGESADLSDLFHRLSLDGALGGYQIDSRFYEIGSPGGLHDFECFVQAQEAVSKLEKEGRSSAHDTRAIPNCVRATAGSYFC